jgi:molybdenum cofactor cytidylyltransferase
MELWQALGVRRGDVVAFVGAGGKTSALLRVGRELAAHNYKVIATTTTKIATDEAAQMYAIRYNSKDLAVVDRAVNFQPFTFIYRSIQNNKVTGLDQVEIQRLLDAVNSDVLLVEADGARRLPFKAPFAHEPVIPPEATLVVPVIGMDTLGRPLDERHVYNPAAMIEKYGYKAGEPIRAPWLASVLRDPELGLKNVPPQARVVPLLNKANGQIRRNAARLVARLALREPRINHVLIGALASETEPDSQFEIHKRVVAVVLAGGLSRRMNQPNSSKVLLLWDDRPIIQVVVDKLKRLRLDDPLVITGHLAAKVRAALKDEPVRFAHNAHYKEGDMLSSLQTGLAALGPEVAACLVVLADQPQLDNKIVNRLLLAYYEGRGLIVAPSYKGRRGHPILIDRCLWPELMNLPLGSSPRDVINAHAAETAYIETDDDSILRDIDTPEAYHQARREAGLE